MKKLCFILLLLWGATAKAQAPRIYITESGSPAGSCPAGATLHNIAFFNSGTNWGAGAGQIGPGTIVLLCGTATTTLVFQGSGTSGNPITLLFDTGAKISQTFCGAGGSSTCLYIGNKAWITVDGGKDCGSSVILSPGTPESLCNGIIEATANGTGQNQSSNPAVFAVQSSHVEMKNLLIRNVYVRTAANDDFVGPNNDVSEPFALNANPATFFHFHNNTVHDANWSLEFITCGAAPLNNIEVDHNYIYNDNHAIAIAVCSQTADRFLLHDNHIGSQANWNPPAGLDYGYHHDGIHVFQAGGGSLTNILVYNNLFDGNWGTTSTTAYLYTEGTGFTEYVWNNVGIMAAGTNMTNGAWGMTVAQNGVGVAKAWNNTVYGGPDQGGPVAQTSGTATDYRNNVIVTSGNGFAALFKLWSQTEAFFDYNIWQNANSQPFCQLGGGGNCIGQNYAGFKALLTGGSGQDIHGQLVANAGINTNGTPIAGGVVATATAANLTSLCTGDFVSLCLDTSAGGTRTPTARPSSGAWTPGAYNVTGAVGSPAISISPASNNFGSVVQNVTSSPVTFTISNTGTANLILNAVCCSTSGTNGTDFVISGQTCANNMVIAPAGTCTVTVVFTPKTIGAETGILQIGSNATGGNANLSGIGTAPGVAVANVTPNPVPFGNVTTGTTSPVQTVTLNNTGTANLTLGNPTFFTVTAPWARTGGTCSAGQILQPAGTGCTFTLTFSPSTTGAQTSTFTVLGNVNGTTTLNGTGVAPAVPSLTVTPAAFSFGNQLQGTQSPLHNFTITNVGGAAATFGPSYFSFTGGSNPTDFARVSPGGADCTNGGVLLAGATCLISVAFTPTTAALESTGLNILSNAPTVSSSLTGTGIFPAITITPNPIAFGSINQGVASPGKVVTIQNTGTAPETFTGTPITVTGPSGAYFAPSAITCSGTLAVNATCTATITFTPGSAGSFTDTFNVNGTVIGTAPLTGTGIAINPVITLAPRPVIFPSTPTSATSSQVTVTVSNATGTSSEVLANPFFTVTTGDSLDFVKVGGTCSNSGTILAGASCTIIFTFTPTGAPRLEQTLLTLNGTVSSNVAMQGLGVTVTTAPLPWSIVSISFSNNYQTVTVKGSGFTTSNVITFQGTPVPTSCTATACIATAASAPVWLPFTNGSMEIGVQ